MTPTLNPTMVVVIADDQVSEETNSYHSEEDIREVYLEFDGASRGNPGRAGAGAVLKYEDGTVITQVREGLGRGTNNDAEYRALIRGLKTALDMGYDVIHVKGDLKLVCKQVKREWRIRSNRLARYCEEAWELIDQFQEFDITYCPRFQDFQISVEPLYISFHLKEDKEEVYLEFDGASRGNPGRAGAVAVLKSEDGAVIARVSEGLGIGTNNDAQCRALSRGLKTALNMGYDRICVRENSKLVCKQINGEQHIRSNRLARYCDETRQLSDQFKKFSMKYCPRSQNTDADWEAQRAVGLPEGRIAREYNWHYESYDESDSYNSIDYSSLYYDQTCNNSVGWDVHQVYLEFDGASRKNPGRAGAGAVLKSKEGAVITRVGEGLGICTNNDAEYRALIRGLKTALDMGYDRIHVKGDSLLVCKQVTGEWRIRNNRLKRYCNEARQLSDQFKEFSIKYCPRSQNADADREAKMAADLPEGEIVRDGN